MCIGIYIFHFKKNKQAKKKNTKKQKKLNKKNFKVAIHEKKIYILTNQQKELDLLRNRLILG